MWKIHTIVTKDSSNKYDISKVCINVLLLDFPKKMMQILVIFISLTHNLVKMSSFSHTVSCAVVEPGESPLCLSSPWF